MSGKKQKDQVDRLAGLLRLRASRAAALNALSRSSAAVIRAEREGFLSRTEAGLLHAKISNRINKVLDQIKE